MASEKLPTIKQIREWARKKGWLVCSRPEDLAPWDTPYDVYVLRVELGKDCTMVLASRKYRIGPFKQACSILMSEEGATQC